MEKVYICLKEAGELLGVDTRTARKILINAGFNLARDKRTCRKILINKDKLMEYMDDKK